MKEAGRDAKARAPSDGLLKSWPAAVPTLNPTGVTQEEPGLPLHLGVAIEDALTPWHSRAKRAVQGLYKV